MYLHTRMVHRYRDTTQVKTHLMIDLFINNQMCTQTFHSLWCVAPQHACGGTRRGSVRPPERQPCPPCSLAYFQLPSPPRLSGAWRHFVGARSAEHTGVRAVGAETSMDLGAAAAVLAPRSSSTRTRTCRRMHGRDVTWFVIRGGHAAAYGAASYRRPRLAVGLCSIFPL